MAGAGPLVSPMWLSDRLGEPGTKVLDATWYLPTAKREGVEDFKAARVPGSRFFDLDSICDVNGTAPHMLPPARAFAAAMDVLDIAPSDTVVVYDTNGIAFAAARAWWMLRTFGHRDVHVLDGGLKAWRDEGLPIDSSQVVRGEIEQAGEACALSQEPGKGDGPSPVPRYPAVLNAKLVSDKLELMAEVASPSGGLCILDARGSGRFTGKEAEIRPGMRSGHIPGSVNVPYSSLLNDGKMIPDDELRSALRGSLEGSARVVATCGSGVTACVIALALNKLGRDAAVYDGSWSEWGKDPDAPVSTGEAQ